MQTGDLFATAPLNKVHTRLPSAGWRHRFAQGAEKYEDVVGDATGRLHFTCRFL